MLNTCGQFRTGGICMLILALVASTGCSKAPARTDNDATRELTVFAGASMGPALTELAELYREDTGTIVKLNFASSGTLARQIEAGAPADIYIAANPKWMDHLQAAALIRIPTRCELLSNRLVLIAPAGKRFDISMDRSRNLAAAFTGRLAIGDPSHVPAGVYAETALKSLGWHDALSSRLSPCVDVRAALRMVARGETEAGIVYASDAATSRDVDIVAVFPESTHEPIRCPAAVTRNAQPGSEALLRWLTGETAGRVFKRYGFTPLQPHLTQPAENNAGANLTTSPVAGALWLSAKVGLWTVVLLLGPGVLLGWLLARREFRGKSILSGVIHVPLVIPPIATGYVLLVLFGVNGVVGRWLHERLGVSLAFTWRAAVLASAVVALPLMVRAVRLAMEQVDRRLEQTARTCGASRLGAFLTVTLPLAAPGIIGGCVLAFARSLGEFGATITFAGNIDGETRTLSLAAFNLMQNPDGDAAAMRLVGVSVAVSLAAVFASELLAARSRRRLAVRA